MNNLLDVPIAAVTALTPERSVVVLRAILRSECGYAKLSPTVLTISSRLTIADGGIDAEVNVRPGPTIPTDCIFKTGVTGFQIKSGTSFKPWTPSSVRGELLNSRGILHSEVERLVRRGGRYTLLCTGHDVTPEQRNDSRQQIAAVLAEVGFWGYEELIEVLGASHIAEFAERYPGTASLLAVDAIQEALVLDEWRQDAHMANPFETFPEQAQMIAYIREGLKGETKHIRVLGEPGLGKTRIVLESVKDENIAPYVLYIQHGSEFGRTRLFRQLLKSGYDKPLVLVIDELAESGLSDIWRHLKPRCGSLKIVSLDHGRDETYDDQIDRLTAPRLPDEIMKNMLASRVGESRHLDRWVAICEGSPRVAQAVADNLQSNPDDLLKPPSTVPVWARFLHGYRRRDESSARQTDCVTQHLALFSRFGYEAPVSDEALYIAELIRKVDPTIGWARFQEVVESLRARRVLQGSRTLFFVPKALHIYLWKQFWVNYGHGFDFTQTFQEMPASLHTWFMNMFKFAGDNATAHVINDILRSDGIFSERAVLASAKGSQFISILAEANPLAVLKLLESTVGKWTDEELLCLKGDRQSLVWALEKIAVWPTLMVRATQVLVRFAVNENANFSNNSTGTLIGLFRIGPEAAATESTPECRLPAMLKLLRGSRDAERRLGLKAMGAALDSYGMGLRIIGPEYQGLKERANLWTPATYDELWEAKLIYFQALVDETDSWMLSLRTEVCQALLEAVEQQIATPVCTELAFQVLTVLVDDSSMPPEKMNGFFWRWKMYKDDGKQPEIRKRMQGFERRYTRRDLASRFRRYVIDVDWIEWNEDALERNNKPKSRAKSLVNALARRMARHPETFSHIQHLLSPTKDGAALFYFGEQLAFNDCSRALLLPLSHLALATKHQVCLHGYLIGVRASDPELYFFTVRGFLDIESSAWLGATLALRTDYDDGLFAQCLDVLGKKWIDPMLFTVLRYGRAIESVLPERTGRLLHQLKEDGALDSRVLLVELLDSIPFADSSPCSSNFVFEVVSRAIPGDENRDPMHSYHWKKVCSKLIKWDAGRTLPLLDALLSKMGRAYRLSYDADVVALTNELVQADPNGAWDIVRVHFEQSLPEWRIDLFQWLKGGRSGCDERKPIGAITDLPVSEILEWIEEVPEARAELMAQAAAGTLDEPSGRLTRELLHRYGHIDGVRMGISATFRSGGWMGPTSAHLKRKREQLRRWLSAGFEIDITQWVEAEIEYLDGKIEREEIDEERSRFD